MYRFFINSKSNSRFSRLHERNAESSGQVTTTFSAGLSSLDTAVSVDGHNLRPNDQASFPTDCMLPYPKSWILILSG